MNLKTQNTAFKKPRQKLIRKKTRPAMDHSPSLHRISRAKGQLEAVVRMIEDQRYCPDIIIQIRAVTNALKATEQEILHRHIRGCVRTALELKDPFDIEEKINEIMTLMSTK